MNLSQQHINFANAVKLRLIAGHREKIAPFKSKTTYESLAREFGITDKSHAKEMAEFATLSAGREIISNARKQGFSEYEQFKTLVDLYEIQPGITHRSSWSTIYQQYSTPIPLAFAAGIWAGLDKLSSSGKSGYAFEPSAGNGLLTIAGDTKYFDVNEIDPFRGAILKQQGFRSVLNRDASQDSSFIDSKRIYASVVSNPPFDKLEIKQIFDGEEWNVLDHLMAAIALSSMETQGRAAIIIGGHTQYDSKGRIKAGKNRQFLSYLYQKYNVFDVINISGELYKKQGTTFDIRLILIDGVNESEFKTYPPLFDKAKPQPIKSFEELWARIFPTSIMKTTKSSSVLQLALKLKAKAALALVESHGIDGSDVIPEIEVSYERPKRELPKILNSSDAADVFRAHFNKHHLELKESMYCMFLDTKNKVLGITRISEGSRTATIADPGFILAVAAKSNANGVIMSHNHPSGDTAPSQADIEITKRVGAALKLIGIQLLDHVIISANNHYSFGDNNLSLGSIHFKGYPRFNQSAFLID